MDQSSLKINITMWKESGLTSVPVQLLRSIHVIAVVNKDQNLPKSPTTSFTPAEFRNARFSYSRSGHPLLSQNSFLFTAVSLLC